jgi:hypothetical protein
VILAGLPSISGRGGDGALEGPGLVEVVPFSPLGLGAALVPGGAAVVAEGASGWWWYWLLWGQQALPPWSLVCPLC